jgi:hypothetical protein
MASYIGVTNPRVTSTVFGGDQLPKQWLLRPISMAAACWLLVADGFPKTAETASHFVGAFSRSPAHPVNVKASSRTMILIPAAYPYLRALSVIVAPTSASGTMRLGGGSIAWANRDVRMTDDSESAWHREQIAKKTAHFSMSWKRVTPRGRGLSRDPIRDPQGADRPIRTYRRRQRKAVRPHTVSEPSCKRIITQ